MAVRTGWVKLERRIMDAPWYQSAETKSVYIHLLFCAVYQGGTTADGVKLREGECLFSRRGLARELGLSEEKVKTALKRLVATHFITQRTTHKFTIAKIEIPTFASGDKTPSHPVNHPGSHHIERKEKNLNNSNKRCAADFDFSADGTL